MDVTLASPTTAELFFLAYFYAKERKCPEATDPRGAKDSIASGAIGRLNINGLLRILAEASPSSTSRN